MTKLYMFLFCIHIFQNLKIQALLCLDEFLFLHLTCEEDLLLPEQKPQYYSEDSHPFVWIHALLGRPSVGHPTSPPPLLNPTVWMMNDNSHAHLPDKLPQYMQFPKGRL